MCAPPKVKKRPRCPLLPSHVDPVTSLDGPLPFHQVLDASLKKRRKKRESGGGEDAGTRGGDGAGVGERAQVSGRFA